MLPNFKLELYETVDEITYDYNVKTFLILYQMVYSKQV